MARFDKLQKKINPKIIIDEKLQSEKVKCENCGHTMYLFHNKTLCSFCGKYVFKTKRDEFEYRLQEQMNRGKRNVG